MPRVKSNLVCVALVIALQTQIAQAQGDLLDADGIAEAIVSMTSRVWTGPRTPAPDPVARPRNASQSMGSPYALLRVHADPGVSRRSMRQALSALDHARGRLDAMGWPWPIPDGDLGGGPDLDLYLSTALPPGAYSDGMAIWSYFDRASTFAVLGPATPEGKLDACATAAYVDALLLSIDPGEARNWRRATAAWLTWELTGELGCDEALSRQQAEPYRSWVAGAAGDGAGGALLLSYLSARHDAVPGQFVRDVWGLASQRTWEGVGLRADPDLWSAIESAVDRSGDRLVNNIEELAVLRWFVGRGDRADAVVASLDRDAKVPISRKMKRLPTRLVASQPLATFGSAYLIMDASTWGDERRLRAWLKGEYGVHWSFVALQLDGRGNEIRRIAAPHSGTTPSAYLPIELDDATQRLLFVVTNLANGLPDADEPDVSERAFELIVDRVDPGPQSKRSAN
ncbi:MAG: hypothetical protein WBB42_14670 [Polyangiales bacterium]